MKSFSEIVLYFHTIKYLKLTQIFARIQKYILSPKVDISIAPEKRSIGKGGFYFIQRPVSILALNQFKFLNVTMSLNLNNSWNYELAPKLWLYNLHYFDGLLNDTTSNNLKNELIDLWIDENPPALGNGWEPYPMSLRIINWIKWSLSGNTLSDCAIHSLATQTRYLVQTLEYHLQGNHLFANAKALIFAGLFFEGQEAEKWYNYGYNILQKQIPEQFLEDGGHFELSTTYHALLTEDLLDITQILRVMGKDVPRLWEKTIKKAVSWLVIMTRPDGLPPLFNDAAYGITPTLEDILPFNRAAGIDAPTKLKNGLIDLKESGYFRYEADNYSFFGDAGQIGPNYIPGHAHCDMMNFELYAHGEPIIVDTGTSTYEVCERRQVERGTASHNTVQIRDNEQSEIWGAFRVARRAKIIKREVANNSIVASYIGYKKNKINHERRFLFEDDCILIDDKIDQSTLAIARLHFHPDVDVVINKNVINAGPIKIEFSEGTSVNVVEYKYAPEFNKLIPAKVLEITFLQNLTTKIIL